ncbi:MAG TPA: metallophosphoesterase [bacterium]|nr:metallophosphoesterase [bacterium]
MKLGIVSDIHCGPDADTRLGSRSPTLLEAFGEAMQAFRPDCIIDLGDRINDVARAQDRQRTAWVRKTLAALGVPVYHVLGNHDVANLSKADLADLLSKRGSYETVNQNGLGLVLLDSQDPPFERIGGTVGSGQREWLHPLDEQRLDGHWYFAAHPAHAYARGREAVRWAIERSGRVLAVFSGHIHWTRVTTIGGIPYVTLGSLVDGGFTHGRPCGTFAAVTVRQRAIDVEVAGLLPERFHLMR